MLGAKRSCSLAFGSVKWLSRWVSQCLTPPGLWTRAHLCPLGSRGPHGPQRLPRPRFSSQAELRVSLCAGLCPPWVLDSVLPSSVQEKSHPLVPAPHHGPTSPSLQRALWSSGAAWLSDQGPNGCVAAEPGNVVEACSERLTR